MSNGSNTSQTFSITLRVELPAEDVAEFPEIGTEDWMAGLIAFHLEGVLRDDRITHLGTVATQPERIAEAERRGAVKALTHIAQRDRVPSRAAWLIGKAAEIENGADL